MTERGRDGLARWWRTRGGAWWWSALLMVVPIVAVTAVAAVVLDLLVNAGNADQQLGMARIVLLVGAGSGALVTLVLAWRRQWHTEHDATERRITELYLKAVEQLGADKAAIRHGGLYALERLAQDNPKLRQTVVEVVCAYLRAPYTPPSDTTRIPRLRLRAPGRKPARRRRTPVGIAGPVPAAAGTAEQERRQEREVRLTAQRLLTRHLRPHDDHGNRLDTFWADIDLDLTAATLIAFTLAACQLRAATFTNATFTGNAGFEHATFTEYAGFEHATFTEFAWFDHATFTGHAWFDHATFTEFAWFDHATFTGHAGFEHATFTGKAGFEHATFTEFAWFDHATFTGHAGFEHATFTQHAGFTNATFTRQARFQRTTFVRPDFESAVFNFVPTALGARVRMDDIAGAPPLGWAIDETSAGPMEGREGSWAPLVPVPVVLPPLP